MRIGIVGAGNIGGTLARLWVAAGHEVMVGFARNPQRLRALTESLGPSAAPGTPAEVADFGEVVVLSVPWPALDEALAAVGGAQALAGRVLVDTCNPFAWPGGPLALPRGATSAGLELSRRLPGTRLVKAFNTLYYVTLAEAAGRPVRLALPMSGDDPDAKELVAGLVQDAGYEPVDIGSLGGAARQEPGGAVYGEELTAGEVGDRLVPRQATFALLMVSALVMTSRSRGWVAACRFRQAM